MLMLVSYFFLLSQYCLKFYDQNEERKSHVNVLSKILNLKIVSILTYFSKQCPARLPYNTNISFP